MGDLVDMAGFDEFEQRTLQLQETFDVVSASLPGDAFLGAARILGPARRHRWGWG